jgi:hypothetical protein
MGAISVSVDGSKLFNGYGNRYIGGSEVLKILFLRYLLVLFRYNICKIPLNFLNYQKDRKYLKKKTEKNTFVLYLCSSCSDMFI